VVAGPAYAGIPLTHRENNAMFTVFTGHVVEGKKPTGVDFAAIATAPGTKVMLMGVENLALVTRELISHGMAGETPAALIRWATTGRQQTLTGTLGSIATLAAERKFQAPAVAVFGDVVHLRDTLSWFEINPLRKADRRHAGLGQTIRHPCFLAPGPRRRRLRVADNPDRAPAGEDALVEAITGIRGYDWIVFTSPNGVEAFFNAFYAAHDDAREIGGARIAAIGNGTAARIREFRIGIDLIPKEFVAESLIEYFKAIDVENLRILLPRAAGARDLLAVELEKLGAIVDDVPVYRTVPETADLSGGMARFREEGADLITFTSASTATHFMALGLTLPETSGPPASGRSPPPRCGVSDSRSASKAERHDIPGLVEAILGFFKK